MPATLHGLYLQLRRDVLDSRLEPRRDVAFDLGAIALQVMRHWVPHGRVIVSKRNSRKNIVSKRNSRKKLATGGEDTVNRNVLQAEFGDRPPEAIVDYFSPGHYLPPVRYIRCTAEKR